MAREEGAVAFAASGDACLVVTAPTVAQAKRRAAGAAREAARRSPYRSFAQEAIIVPREVVRGP